jgi:hypothetical protein
MLLDLASGARVGVAVDSGNQYLKDHPPTPVPGGYVRPVWKTVGDSNVTIKASQ